MPRKINSKKNNGSKPHNDPGHYQGKPGPAPTGLKRKILFPFMVNQEEFEYLKRVANHRKTNVTELIRRFLFKKDWRDNLDVLRQDQGANL